MKKLLYSLNILCLFMHPLNWASEAGTGTPSPREAALSGHSTISEIMPRVEQRYEGPYRRRSQQKTYDSSFITGSTGFNALAAKTGGVILFPTTAPTKHSTTRPLAPASKP